ncbi:MAG: response regulator [Myxococcota bacterium]
MNNPSKMPCCYSPSTVLCIDDDKQDLCDMAVSLALKNVRYRLQLKPDVMLDLINSQKSPWRPDPGKEIYNANRFERVCVAVVDYNMPGLNGLEFCKKLHVPSIRRIIVSTDLPPAEATKALQGNWIRAHLSKGTADTMPALQTLIECSIAEHFCEESGTFQQAGEEAGSCLTDKYFIKWFRQMLDVLKAEEYYLLDAAGTFLLCTNRREVYGLCIRTLPQLQQLAQQASEKGAPKYIVEGLKRGQCMLCPPDPCAQQLTESLPWGRCVLPVRHVLTEGKQNYYCNWSAGLFDVDNSQITSFYQYQEQHPD